MNALSSVELIPNLPVTMDDKKTSIVLKMNVGDLGIIDKCDIKVSGCSLIVTIKASRESVTFENDVRVIDYAKSKFSRSLILPFKPKLEAVVASQKESTITISIPKPD